MSKPGIIIKKSLVVLTFMFLVVVILLLLNKFYPSVFIQEQSTDYKCSNCNVVLITADALRADHLGCYGYSKITSPFIDSFAEDSWLFMNAFSQCGSTICSIPSLFTSKYPLEILFKPIVSENSSTGSRVDLKDMVTLADILRQNGYVTVAVVSHTYVKSEFGMSKGFDFYEDNFYPLRNAEETSNLILNLSDNSKRNKPFFMWIHFREPHNPYNPPKQFFDFFYDQDNRGLTFYDTKKNIPGSAASYKELHDRIKSGAEQQYILFGETYGLTNKEIEQLRALYDGNIKYLDYNLGRLFDHLNSSNLTENTIVIFTSDHGESLGEHNIFDHNDIYYNILHVPLILKHPKLKKRIVENQVSLLDITPTILGMLGIESEEKYFRGKNLFLENHDFQFVSISPEDYTIIIDDWKLLHKNGSDYLFNIKSDPDEEFDLKEQNKSIFEILKTKASKALSEQSKLIDSEPLPNKTIIDESLRGELKSLGYIV